MVPDTDAIDQLIQRIAREPDEWELRRDLVGLLGLAGRHREALDAGIALAEARPREPSAWSSLGTAMQRARNWEGAEMAYRRALLLKPDDAPVTGALGQVLRERGQLADALGYLQRSLELDGEQAEIWSSLGNALLASGDFRTATDAHTRAVQLGPERAAFWANLGKGYRHRGLLEDALAAIDAGLRIDPELPGLRWNRALVRLMQGHYRDGFAEYQWRLRRPRVHRPDWIDTAWNGEPLERGVLELHTEQGFGDALQFARFVSLASERVPRVVLRVHPKMVSILSGVSGIDRVRSREEPSEEGAVRQYLMSLPGIFGIEDIDGAPYLRDSPQRRAAWARRLATNDDGGFRVGLCWQGNPAFEADRHRSPGLEAFSPLSRISGLRLISLQKYHGLEQLERLAGPLGIEDLGRELDNGGQAFEDTAAVMKNLDLVITSDTATAHLAGALGVPTWVVLNSSPDWRWGPSGERTCWYDDMRLFRQPRAGAWDSVFRTVSESLIALLEERK